MNKPCYFRAQDEVHGLMVSCGFEKVGDVNFLFERFNTDWGDAVLYVNWQYKILVAYRFGNPVKVLYGRELKPEFVEKILSIDKKYGADGRWLISHGNKELRIAVASYFIEKEKKDEKKKE